MRSKEESTFSLIKACAEAYFAKNGVSPTVRELAQESGISRPTVQRYLTAMRESGAIEYSGRRGISTSATKKMNIESVCIGIVGEIACGTPAFAEENIEEYIRLPRSLVGQGTFFLLRAKGESMKNVGISQGDLVLVRQQNAAEPGEIVVALIEDETTLKRYFPEPSRRRVRLHPENEAFSDIVVSDCRVLGVAVKVIRDLTGTR